MRTLYGTALATSNYLGIPHIIMPNTTLNKKFDVSMNESDTPINLSYFAVGFKPQDTISSINLRKRAHKPQDGDLYNHLPFRFVEEGLRLSIEQRNLYRIEKKLIISNKVYYAYYIKKFRNDALERYIEVENIEEGKMNLFSTESEVILHPEYEDDLTTDNSVLAYSKTVKLEISPIEVADMKIAFDLLFPYVTNKVIDDIMLVSGSEHQDVLGYKTALSLQANFFFNVELKLEDIAIYGQNILYELGGVELSNEKREI